MKNIDYVIASIHTPFFPSGTNPIYRGSEKINIRIEKEEVIAAIKEASMITYTRDATKRTREKGKYLDLRA